MKNEMNYTESELEDLRVVSREIMDAEIEAIRAEVEAERAAVAILEGLKSLTPAKLEAMVGKDPGMVALLKRIIAND